MSWAKPQKSWIAALFAIAALVAIACGGSDTSAPLPTATLTPAPTETPLPGQAPQAGATTPVVELTAEEAGYIEQVRAGWNVFHSKAGGFREAFGQFYAMKSRLFETLKDAGAGSAFEGALRAVEQITPPQRFQGDHQVMLQAMAKMVEYDHDVGRAVDNQDLPAFAVANGRMAETVGLMALQLSAVVCLATNAPDQPFSFCNSNELLPGGQYGIQLNAAIARLNIGFVARSSIFPPAFTASDQLATLAVFQPETINLYLQTLDEVNALPPPSDLRTDHLRLVQYLEEQLENNREGDSAVQAQDLDKYREVSGQAIGLFCGVRQDISPEMMKIVRVHFGDDQGLCGAPAAEAPSKPDAGDLLEVTTAELQRYLDAVAPAFQQARLDRLAVDQEFTAPGPQSQADAVAAWFVPTTDLMRRMVDALSAVEPPVGLTSIHDELVLAASGWKELGSRVVDLLAGAGPDFDVGRDLANHPELGVTASIRLSSSANASCALIQRMAADNGFDIDLACNVIFR